jgi:peroxiredoxin
MPRPLPLILALVLLAGCGVSVRHETWPGGAPKQHGKLEDGQQAGTWTYWYQSGKRQAEGEWRHDRQDGDWTWWYEDGTPKQSGRYAAALRTGTWSYWYPNGQLYCRGDYRDDHQVGPWAYFHPSGKRAAIGVFADGAKALGWRWWREDGSAQEQGAYFAGRKVGPWTAWGVDGKAQTTDQGCPPGAGCYREPATGEPVRRWIAHFDTGVADPWFGDVALAFDDQGLLSGAASVDAGAPGSDASERFVAYRPDGAITAAYDGPPVRIRRRDQAADARAWSLWTADGERDEAPASAAAARAALLALHARPAEQKPVKVAEAKRDLALPAKDRVALTPMAVLPISFWTKHEEATAGQLIQRYITGRQPQSGAAAYGSDEGRPQRRDLQGKPLAITRLLSSTGDVIDLDDFKGKKNVVLVVLRGFAGQVCVYCATQTAALAKSIDRFHAVDAEVVLVYPGAAESAPVFLEAVRSLGVDQPAIPIGLDVDLQLVRALRISHQLAKPTSLIIDKQGNVRYAYVGEDRGDRPSVDDLLRQLQKLAPAR